MQQACRFENDLRLDMMQIEAESGPIPMALVQNKVDLMDQVGLFCDCACWSYAKRMQIKAQSLNLEHDS